MRRDDGTAPVRVRSVLTAYAGNSRPYLDGGFVANAAGPFGVVRAGAPSAMLIVVGFAHLFGRSRQARPTDWFLRDQCNGCSAPEGFETHLTIGRDPGLRRDDGGLR